MAHVSYGALPADPTGNRRGFDLHVLADARRLHHADAGRRRGLGLHRQRRLPERGRREQHPVRGGVRCGAAGDHGPIPGARAQAGGIRGAVIGSSRASRIALAVWTALIMLFLFVPIAIIIVYAFNPANVQSWPLRGLSTRWFSSTWHNAEARHALWLSVRAGLLADAIALLLGTCAAFAVHRFRFFGREAVSFLLVLPLALPGIITGMALNSFFSFTSTTLSLTTIVVGHATFCIVVVYNNVLARLRRTPPSLIEASMDLGADGWQTFRYVTLPVIATALVAGGLLAFALSFDEIVVTIFTAGAHAHAQHPDRGSPWLAATRAQPRAHSRALARRQPPTANEGSTDSCCSRQSVSACNEPSITRLRNSVRSLTCGKAMSGTGSSRNSHNGSHPSVALHTSRRSGGTLLVTS